jgi:predicted XRE-type DNA-binding protein
MKLAQQGEGNGSHKLSESEVIEILNLLESGNYMQKDIAKVFNVLPSNICKIKTSKSWNHIDKQTILTEQNLQNGVNRMMEDN